VTTLSAADPASIDPLDIRNQPPQPGEDRWRFTEDLKAPMWSGHPWGKNRAGAQDADLSRGVTLKPNFPDPAGRLATAYDDLRLFLAAGRVSTAAGSYVIETAATPGLQEDAFRIETSRQSSRILAGGPEGIRRGIFRLEDEMLRRRGPFLPIGTVEQRPAVRRLISRCFFGPIKRPPKMRDELMDDVDYYPEQYLNRLAHEGVNGLWLTVEFRDLVSTPFTPDYGKQAARRLDKLRRTVAACLRYGIRTYIFSIEPRAWDADSPVPEKFPDMAGVRTYDGKRYFCPAGENGRQYLYQSVNAIFRAVPDLGGLINISHGERPTTCLSALSAVGDGRIDCPRCSRLAPWEILHSSLSAMERGMRDAAPGAELISWLYMPQARGGRRDDLADWVYELPAHTPKNVVLQFNFESGVRRTEFGKTLVGGDYWISTPGPSQRFERIARTAREHGTPVSAKIQTANSHEVATAPYLPVPSLLYRKFAAMRSLGVTHSMLCWYFGNYPGLMNKAAGQLAGEPFPTDENAFLARLASIYWGEEAAPAVVRAWKLFAAGYENFPLTTLFQYYGPMHDGPVWPLLLKPRDAPLTPTWLLASNSTRAPYPPSGDRIGESFMETLTLDETVELARRMSSSWDQGLAVLDKLEPQFRHEPERTLDIGVARALGIQFRSGYNILRFYRLREQMLRADGKVRLDMLRQLSAIVREELAGNERLLALCRRDSRLGFHSEAEGYKYFPEKIQWRMGQLREVLARDVPEVERTIREDKPLFPEYTGRQPTGAVARSVPAGGALWSSPELEPPPGLRWESLGPTTGTQAVRWAAAHDAEALYIVIAGAAGTVSSVQVKVEPRRLWPARQFVYTPGAEPRMPLPDTVAPQTVEGRIVKETGGWRAAVRIPFRSIGHDAGPGDPLRVDVRLLRSGAGTVAWRPQTPLPSRLALGSDNPADLGWLLFDRVAARVSAHRGDNKAAPENTIPAIFNAVKKGAHQIEFDVKLSKDGNLVIMHDPTVNRTTNGKGRVADLSFDELRQLDAGSWFSPKFAGTRIPTLREVLQAIPPSIQCNVHLADTPRLAAETARTILEMGRVSQCVLACTKEQAAEARALAPGLRWCNMSGQRRVLQSYVDDTIATGADFIQLLSGLDGLADAVKRLHRRGITVNYFSAQQEPLIRKLSEAGVDYILTDDLDLALSVLSRP
jgi:glycerophosphoryl diester phosphodiesterase